MHLLQAKCVPILLYGCEAVDMSPREISSRPMDFAFVRFIIKIFKCTNRHIIDEIFVKLRYI